MKRIIHAGLLAALVLISSFAASGGTTFAQRVRTVGDAQSADKQPAQTVNRPAAPLVQSVKAKYEGGVFGYNKKQTGTLVFDDGSSRMIFRDKMQKEYISFPYAAVAAAYADTRSRRPGAATAIGSASIYTLPALLVRKKYRYLTVQFNDPDTKVQGVTSFKVDGKDTLESVLATLAAKADLTPRGEAYVRRPMQP